MRLGHWGNEHSLEHAGTKVNSHHPIRSCILPALPNKGTIDSCAWAALDSKRLPSKLLHDNPTLIGHPGCLF